MILRQEPLIVQNTDSVPYSAVTKGEVDFLLDRLRGDDVTEFWAALELHGARAGSRWHDNPNLLRFCIDSSAINRSTIRQCIESHWSFHWLPAKTCGEGRSLAVTGPMRFQKAPQHCYHATPETNLERILSVGLVAGIAAERSTTGRDDAGHYIYISFDTVAANEWATDDQLLRKSRDDRHQGKGVSRSIQQ